MEELDVPDYFKRETIYVYSGHVPVQNVPKSWQVDSKLRPVWQELGIATKTCRDLIFYSKNKDSIDKMIQAQEEQRDDYTIGLMYGYPECCVKEFADRQKLNQESYLYDPAGSSFLDQGFSRVYALCNACMNSHNSQSSRIDAVLRETLKNLSRKLYESLLKEKSKENISNLKLKIQQYERLSH